MHTVIPTLTKEGGYLQGLAEYSQSAALYHEWGDGLPPAAPRRLSRLPYVTLLPLQSKSLQVAAVQK